MAFHASRLKWSQRESFISVLKVSWDQLCFYSTTLCDLSRRISLLSSPLQCKISQCEMLEGAPRHICDLIAFDIMESKIYNLRFNKGLL